MHHWAIAQPNPATLNERRQNCIDCICSTFIHCVFSGVYSNSRPQGVQIQTSCIFLNFSTVCFQMSPQITWLRGCIITQAAFAWEEVTLAAFICLFSFCSFECFLKNRCIVTLVTFVWTVSTVGFQLAPQRTFIIACIVTLAAFVWLFSTTF